MAVTSINSLPSTLEVGARSEWPQIADDLADQRALNKPILIFSTAGMLTDMIDMYAGDDLAGVKIITLQDGVREQSIGYHRWAERGLSLADVRNGVLDQELNPADPTNDAVWVILRFGGNQVAERLEILGYAQIGAFRYTDTVLYLYARPQAVLGQPIPVDNSFRASDDPEQGWQISESHVQIEPTDLAGASARQIVMTEDRARATYSFAAEGGGLVTVELDVRVIEDGQARITVRCESATGESLAARSLPLGRIHPELEWQNFRGAMLCPGTTARVTVTLERRGPERVIFRNLGIQFNPNLDVIVPSGTAAN